MTLAKTADMVTTATVEEGVWGVVALAYVLEQACRADQMDRQG